MMMMSSLKLVLIFGAALGLCHSFNAQNKNHLASVVPQYNTNITDQLTAPTSAPRPDPGFHYFLFVLQWPAAFCNIQRQRKCKTDPPNKFTVHGLWPQLNGSKSPLNCTENKSMEDSILKPLEKDLLKYWPDLSDAENLTASKEFVKYQWNKHGTCSSNEFTPQKYLKNVLKLAREYAEKRLCIKNLKKKGIKPDGTTMRGLEPLRKIVMELTGKYPILKTVFNDSGHRLLLEIQLCVKKDGSALVLIDCDELYRFAVP